LNVDPVVKLQASEAIQAAIAPTSSAVPRRPNGIDDAFRPSAASSVSPAASEALNPPLGTVAAQIHSATVAQEDLYTFPALVTTPSTIYGVAIKAFVAKSDSGARTVSLNMKSGSSDSTGSSAGQAMSTTNQWQRSFFDVDPATGVAWTRAGLNAASSGVSVAS